MNAIHARSQLRYWPTLGKKVNFSMTFAAAAGFNPRARCHEWLVHEALELKCRRYQCADVHDREHAKRSGYDRPESNRNLES